ncbi:MAG: HAD family phosphatase [Eubacteriaceae bacterium]|nr:HAD family phosphatase [Eubacteriaceae bacterium]
MKYKLIAVDIDGTLLNSEGKLTEVTRSAIRKAVDAGAVFTISTGRPVQGVTSLVEEIGLDLPLITYNGSMVLKAKTREIIYSRTMTDKDAKMVYQTAVEWDVNMILWSDNKLYSTRDNEKSRYYSHITKTELNIIENFEDIKAGITKILWYEEPEVLKDFLVELDKLLDKDSVVFHTSRPYFLEFVDKGASKAIAIEKLGEEYGIKREEIIAIGDSYNDISMISYAGLGVAMNNAPDDIKAIADYITKSCDEDGVAHVIREFILGEEE